MTLAQQQQQLAAQQQAQVRMQAEAQRRAAAEAAAQQKQLQQQMKQQAAAAAAAQRQQKALARKAEQKLAQKGRKAAAKDAKTGKQEKKSAADAAAQQERQRLLDVESLDGVMDEASAELGGAELGDSVASMHAEWIASSMADHDAVDETAVDGAVEDSGWAEEVMATDWISFDDPAAAMMPAWGAEQMGEGEECISPNTHATLQNLIES